MDRRLSEFEERPEEINRMNQTKSQDARIRRRTQLSYESTIRDPEPEPLENTIHERCLWPDRKDHAHKCDECERLEKCFVENESEYSPTF